MRNFTENELIARFFAPLSGEGAFDLKDDAAVLNIGVHEELVVSTDTLVAGVHFFENAKPQDIAAKALRSNLSDLAAKGAIPIGYMLALAMPKANAAWLQDFSTQLKKDQKRYRITLLGGDTTKSKLLTITVSIFGRVPKGEMVRRAGAKPGDILAVTGTIGDAVLGLKIL
ncbi:MAG: thiamine-phosphate kinase, partial [Pseudomonadota bacterium]